MNIQDYVKDSNVQELMKQAVCCNTEGTVTDAGATELAMLKFITRCSQDDDIISNMRAKYVPQNMTRFAFDSSRKRMSTIIELGEDEKTQFGYQKRLHCKGASEIVIAECDEYLDVNGNVQKLDDTMR